MINVHLRNKQQIYLALIILLYFILANIFALNFVKSEQTFYFADEVNYWNKSIELSKLCPAPVFLLKRIAKSISIDDYTDLGAVIFAPFFYLFNNSRLLLIILILNIYALPAVLMFWLLVKELFKSIYPNMKFALTIIVFSTFLLSNIFWSPILDGFIDVGGLLIISVILFIFSNKNIYSISLPKILSMSLLITLLLIFRRTYTTWAISLFLILLFKSVLEFRKIGNNLTFIPLAKAIGVVIISTLLFLNFRAPYFVSALNTNYADIYSAFSHGNFWQNISRLLDYFGRSYLGLFLLAAIFLIFFGKNKRMFLLFFIQFVLIFVLFIQVQGFGTQHYYLLLPTVLLFIAIFIVNIYNYLKSRLIKSLFLCAYLLFLCINFLVVFFPMPPVAVSDLFSHHRQYPIFRSDIKEIDRILIALNQLLRGPEDRIYIIASSDRINGSLLTNAYLTLRNRKTIEDKILITFDVDKRDGFPVNFLKANFVLVAKPVQYHLNPKDQRIIGVLAESVLNKENVGKAFYKLPYEFFLEKNTRVYIYQKNRPFYSDELQQFSELLCKYYPDRADIYSFH